MAPSQESESKILDLFSTAEELQDIHNNAARQLQAPHGKETEEQDGSDADGEQGGQQWRPPTASPSQGPTAWVFSLLFVSM